MSQPYQNYRRVEISTADPTRIIVLLYEGAIKNLNQCARLMTEDRATAAAKLGRTQEIILYLRNSLDHDKGGEIAANLERLYDYMRDTLNQANLHSDRARVQEVITLLQTLLEGWRGIATTTQTEHPVAEAPPAAPLGLSMVG